MKKCMYCGLDNEDSATICASCGAKVDEIPPPQPQNEQNLNNNAQNGFYNGYNPNEQQYGESVISLIFGILGIVLCVINYLGVPFFHLIGLGFGIAATVRGSNDQKAKKRYAKAGFIMGIVAICLGVCAMIIGCLYTLSL